MAFSLNLVEPVRRVARQNGSEPESLLAVVEIECGGQPFEQDGRTQPLRRLLTLATPKPGWHVNILPAAS